MKTPGAVAVDSSSTTKSSVYLDNPILHPLRTLGRKIRAWAAREIRRSQLQRDANASHPITGDFDGGDIPPVLQKFQTGEFLPWKGVRFRVGKVVGGDFPCVILVPAGVTHGRKLQILREYRDIKKAEGNVQ